MIPHRLVVFAVAATLCLVALVPVSEAADWLQWRGPTGDNHAAPDATAPVRWSESEGLAWNTPLPRGAGHSSPTVVAGKIYLTTADTEAQTQSLVILDEATGRILKQTTVHQGGLAKEIHPNNTHASPTVASDGQRVFALFLNNDAAMVTAFDLEGNELWRQRAGGFDPQMYQFGFGSSPRVVNGLVVVSTEYDGPESGIYALNASDGSHAWKANRPESLSYSTPAVATLGGRTQLMLTGNHMVASYDSTSGGLLWSVEGTTKATCGTMVWDEGLGMVFGSGGYPDRFTIGVRLGDQPEIAWKKNNKCYEQSMLIHDGHLYAVDDNGVAFCRRASDGEEMWKERLGGKYSSSPLLVGDRIYVTDEGGTTRVFPATPERFELISVNQLGDSGFATPTPVNGRLYHRYAKGEGDERQEFLAAIGE